MHNDNKQEQFKLDKVQWKSVNNDVRGSFYRLKAKLDNLRAKDHEHFKEVWTNENKLVYPKIKHAI